jgi:hypothetical protein
MAKRLHDTEIWRKLWFRSLSKESKLLWLYLKDNCDCAGIADISDMVQISFFTGLKITEKNFEDISKQIKRIDAKRVLILDFIEFQYGELTETHKMYKKVISELAKFCIKYPIDTVSAIADTVKDKDIDMDIDIDKDKDICIDWRENFDIYLSEELTAYQKLISDKAWIEQQEKYYPNIDIVLSLEKCHSQYWGTEAGWKKKKAARSKDINWKRTFETALSFSMNQVRRSYGASIGFNRSSNAPNVGGKSEYHNIA